MSRTHLRSHTLLLWLSLSVTASALLSVGCSSSDDPGPTASAGKGGGGNSGGSTSKAGSSSSEAGDAAVGGEPGEPDPGEGGRTGTPSGGSGGTSAAGGGSVAGGPTGSGDAGETGEGGAAGAADAVDPVAAAQARAVTLIQSLAITRRCTTCHDVNYQGNGFYPNITPDLETGIGAWEEEDIKRAISEGKDNEGKTLCATMERYAFSEEELSDLAIYLKHLAPKKNKISVKCPSL